MNSAIISFVYSLAQSFWGLFKKSGTYKLFESIYKSFSNAWKHSIIVNLFKKDEDTDEVAKSSLLYKVFNSVFVFLTFLRNKLGNWLKDRLEKSCFVHMGQCYLQNILALNSRFIGIMSLVWGVVYLGAKFVMYSQFSKISIVLTVIGAVLCIGNYNMTAFLAESRFVKFVIDALGFHIHYDFYEKKRTKGIGRLVLAALVGIAMGVLTLKSPVLALALPCGLFGMCLVLNAPITGVFFAVFAAPFVPTMVLALLCLLTLFSLIIRSLTTQYFKWKFDGVGLGVMFLLAIFLISSITSFAPMNSLTVWIMYFVFMSFYFVVINTVNTKKQLYALLKIFVIAGAFVALYGVMQYVFGWNTSNAWIDETMFENDTMRVYSTLENPNVLGEYLLLVMPISAVFMCKFRVKEFSKWVYMGITALLFLCLILTQSRGCWLGFMLAAVIFVTFSNGKLWGLLPVALAIIPFIIPQTIVDRLMSIGNMDDSSTSYRVFIWFGTLAMLKHFWIGGIGMGEKAFNSVYPFYSYNAIIAPHSHNLFLQLITESGISALMIFLVTMVVFVVKMGIVYMRDKKTSFNSLAALAFISGLAGFLLQSMFDYTFYNYRVMAMFFMFMAMGMTLKYLTKNTVSAERK